MRRAIGVFIMMAVILGHVQSTEGQQAVKVRRIAVMAIGFLQEEYTQALRDELRSLGYIEGKNLLIEYRFAEGKLDRLQELVSELSRLNAEIIVSSSTEAIEMVRETNKSIPVVMAGGLDPIGSGLVASLAKPGGSITGISQVSKD